MRHLSPLLTFITTFALLLFIEQKTPFQMLIISRFFGETAGLIQIILVASYTAIMTKLMLSTKDRAKWRSILWTTFSLVFFAQLFLGLLGFSQFLQTGTLHYPIPALIVSGPLYRLEGFFMVGLFLTTVILAGPSWCSHLCYVGAIDNWAARGKKEKHFKQTRALLATRYIILFLAITLPLLFMTINASPWIVHLTLLLFLSVSIAIIFLSRKYKRSMYCSYFCPISILSSFLGKLNPFRLKINSSCDSCGKCARKCNYDALVPSDASKFLITDRCNLCMDCTSTCHKNSIRLTLFKRKEIRYDLFYIIVLTLHGVFLACARI